MNIETLGKGIKFYENIRSAEKTITFLNESNNNDDIMQCLSRIVLLENNNDIMQKLRNIALEKLEKYVVDSKKELEEL